jgi:secreted PhoX family phosphatase
MVHECDPTTLNAGVARPAMGVFSHEAVCVDPVNQRLYLTEDEGDGCLYRFTPDAYPSLLSGLLEVAVGTVPGTVTWEEVPNPQGGAAEPTRQQVAAAAHFDGGEGTWFDNGTVYFTTKGDSRVWTLNVATNQIEILYDEAAVGPDAPLSGVDNITVSPAGDIFVCEDGRDHDICLITPGFEVSRFLKLDPVLHSGPPVGSPFAGNETVGVVFSPDGATMYFGAQRSFPVAGNEFIPAGVVYEINGPFRGATPDRGPRTAPKVKLKAKKRRAVKRFLDKGFPIRLELDQPCGIDATLRVPAGGEKKGSVAIARAKTSVAVDGRVGLMLEPTKKAPNRLDEGEETRAKLRVVATNARKQKTVLTRKVTLGFEKDDDGPDRRR